MPPQRNSTHARRQRPVSCHFCRSRKLRCSRDSPCSNCIARGLSCQLWSSEEPEQPHNESEPPSNSELLERLQRLEALVARSHASSDTHSNTSPATVAETPLAPRAVLPVPTNVQRLTADVTWLEETFVSKNFLDPSLSEPIGLRICPLSQITKPSNYVPVGAGQMSWGDEVTRCIWLPRLDEMNILLEKYFDDVTQVQHVILVPQVRKLVDEVYLGSSGESPVNASAVMLLLSIIASAMYSWTVEDCRRGIFTTAAEANGKTQAWAKATLDVLDHINRSGTVTIECIQAIIITAFVVCNLEGISARARYLFCIAITHARELSLHRVDSGKCAEISELDKEVRRRLWWYLVASDWMLASFGGPQEGFYALSPHHMMTEKPSNTDDEDLMDGSWRKHQSLNKPTIMSYFIQRIRLAELWRHHTDRIRLSGAESVLAVYKHVQDMEVDLNQFERELPEFLRYEDESGSRNWQSGEYPNGRNIAVQRYMLESLLNAQRCKLHLPYLARSFADSTFEQSREVCLRTAQRIIRMERRVVEEPLPFASIRLKIAGTMYSIFMACIVFVSHMCLDKTACQNPALRDGLRRSFRVLSDAKDASSIAARLLEALKYVLQKENVRPATLSSFLPDMIPDSNQVTESGVLMHHNVHEIDVPVRLNGTKSSSQLPPPAEEELESLFNLGDAMGFGNLEWSNLFQGFSAEQSFV